MGQKSSYINSKLEAIHRQIWDNSVFQRIVGMTCCAKRHFAEKLETQTRRQLAWAQTVKESSLATASESQQINSHTTVQREASQKADIQWLIRDNERRWAGRCSQASGERQGCWAPLLASEGMAEGKSRAENFKVKFSCSWPHGHLLERNSPLPWATLPFDEMSRGSPTDSWSCI